MHSKRRWMKNQITNKKTISINMKKTTIIVPLNEYSEDVKKYLASAIDSVNLNLHDVMFVGPKDVIAEAVKEFNTEHITLVENDGDTDFFSQINKAAFSCLTPYFSILEFDDIYLPNWDKIYNEEDLSGLSIIIPFNEYFKDGYFASFGNELAWDVAFLEEGAKMGVITEHELKVYNDFNITGGVIKTEDFISLGGFNPEYKQLAWFEFLMRAVRKDKTFYVIPRVCYRHTMFRDGSYMTKETMPQEEYIEKVKAIVGVEEED